MRPLKSTASIRFARCIVCGRTATWRSTSAVEVPPTALDKDGRLILSSVAKNSPQSTSMERVHKRVCKSHLRQIRATAERLGANFNGITSQEPHMSQEHPMSQKDLKEGASTGHVDTDDLLTELYKT